MRPKNRIRRARVLGICLLAAAMDMAYGQLIPEPTESVLINQGTNSAHLYIYKADTNQMTLQNPVLFVEGFDIENESNWAELYTLFNQENLIEELKQYGRDTLIVNFQDATDRVEDNAQLIENTIDFINTNRTALTDKFTVIGASMGGLVTRLALTAMPDHEVDSWISFDAPHRGANVPLGFQKFIDFYTDYAHYSDQFEPMVEIRAAMDSDAAKQMLLVYYADSYGEAAQCNTNHTELMALLDSSGYPTNCKTIAISNGSGLGEKHDFSPGDPAMYWDNPQLPWIEGMIYALPQTPADGGGENYVVPEVFSGLFYVFTLFGGGQTSESAQYDLPLENAPGGTANFFEQMYTALAYTDSGDDSLSITNHCFVPTVSSLDIPIENIGTNLSEASDILALSPFDEIHLGITNEEHMNINARNKRWFMRAVLEDIDTDGDGLEDYTEYLIGTDYAATESALNFDTEVTFDPAAGEATLNFEALANTQYKIWFTDALGAPWIRLNSLDPDSYPRSISRIYDMTNAAGYFKMTAEPIDPVTD